MNKVNYKVTNQELFDEKINDIDTSGLKRMGTDQYGKSLGFSGDLELEQTSGGGWYTVSGDFYAEDYKHEFGFILI